MAVKKNSAKKYSAGTSKQVAEELHGMKRGKLTSGRSTKKVTNPKQAIAIGLSEARRAGKKVPPPPKKSASAKKTASKSAAKKTPAKKASATKKASVTKKKSAKKAVTKKSAN